MKVKELVEILQKYDSNRKIIFINDNGVYTINPDDPVTPFSQKRLNNMVIMCLKELGGD